MATIYGKRPIARGGDLIYKKQESDGLYVYHEFLTVGSSSFIVFDDVLIVDYLIVAGGGGGLLGNNGDAGGGAGGLILNNLQTLTKGTYPIIVGAAGLSHKDGITSGTNGGDSIAFDLTAIGGGRSGNASIRGADGGSGGGNAYYSDTLAPRRGGEALQPSATPGIGYGSPIVFRTAATVRGGGAGGEQPGANYYDGLTVWGEIYGIGGFGGLGGLASPGGRPNSGDGGGGVGGLTPSPKIGNDAGSGIVVIRYKVT
jgi:hypothetical protein